MIRLAGVTKHYPGVAHPAVDALDLEVPEASTTALHGSTEDEQFFVNAASISEARQAAAAD